MSGTDGFWQQRDLSVHYKRLSLLNVQRPLYTQTIQNVKHLGKGDGHDTAQVSAA